MARKTDKHKAIKLRQKGYSYSQIKTEIGVSKSTLRSGWLRNMPLSKQRVLELQKSDQVIEKIRTTKKKNETDV